MVSQESTEARLCPRWKKVWGKNAATWTSLQKEAIKILLHDARLGLAAHPKVCSFWVITFLDIWENWPVPHFSLTVAVYTRFIQICFVLQVRPRSLAEELKEESRRMIRYGRRLRCLTCISHTISIVFLTLYQLYFSHYINCISLTISIMSLSLYQLYFSHYINCISLTVSNVFLSLYKMYFSHIIDCISLTLSIVFLWEEIELRVGYKPHALLVAPTPPLTLTSAWSTFIQMKLQTLVDLSAITFGWELGSCHNRLEKLGSCQSLRSRFFLYFMLFCVVVVYFWQQQRPRLSLTQDWDD